MPAELEKLRKKLAELEEKVKGVTFVEKKKFDELEARVKALEEKVKKS